MNKKIINEIHNKIINNTINNKKNNSINFLHLLNQCIKHNDILVLKYIISCNKPDQLINSQDETPLHIAAKWGNLYIFNFLINISYYNINSLDKSGNSPLYIAILWNKIDIVKKLLLLNVDVNIINNIGETPLIKSIKDNNVEIIELLLTKDVNINLFNEFWI